MKRICKIVIVLCIIVICNSINVSETKASSGGITVINDFKVQVVDDIDNYPYPETTTIAYEYDQLHYSKLIIDSPGQIKAFFTSQNDDRAAGEAWISTDITGNNIIGKVFNFNSWSKETSWFLAKGTYYLMSKCTNSSCNFNLSLLYEKAKADNSGAGDSFTNSHKINLSETNRGFLTNTTPNEYYSFELSERTAVTFKYSFDATVNDMSDTGHITLFDNNEIFIKDETFSKSDGGLKKFTYTLEKGTYYVKMSGMLGNTTLSLSPMYYKIKLTPDTDGSWTDEPIDVDIETGIDFSKITVLKKDIASSLVDNNMVWSGTGEDAVACDGLSFKATKSGVYSVRVTDIYGNNTMEKIKISNIDVKKPTIKGVTNDKAYKKPVTITWSDKQSGINPKKTTLNGKTVSSGITVSKEGKYTLKVYDQMGNYVKKLFYIDNTAPTAGVEAGKTYSDTVTLRFKDTLSGIKKITIDDVEQPSGYSSLYLFQNGNYTVKLWDNAGNYRKVTFQIKK